VCHYDGRGGIKPGSNNYLGLTNHPKLIEAALRRRALSVWARARCAPLPEPCASTWSWKRRLRRFKNVEACVVFQSGFHGPMRDGERDPGRRDFILSDELTTPAS